MKLELARTNKQFKLAEEMLFSENTSALNKGELLNLEPGTLLYAWNVSSYVKSSLFDTVMFLGQANPEPEKFGVLIVEIVGTRFPKKTASFSIIC